MWANHLIIRVLYTNVPYDILKKSLVWKTVWTSITISAVIAILQSNCYLTGIQESISSNYFHLTGILDITFHLTGTLDYRYNLSLKQLPFDWKKLREPFFKTTDAAIQLVN